MPKDRVVHTESISVPDISGNSHQKSVSVLYAADADNFYAKLPAHLVEGMGYERSKEGGQVVEKTLDGFVRGRSPQDVMKSVRQHCKDYLAALTQKRRVIVYHVRSRKKAQESYAGESDFFFEKGAVLAVDWDDVWEVSTGDRKSYFRCDEETLQKIGKPGVTIIGIHYNKDEKSRVLEWTKEREEFFQALQTGMEGLIDRCRDFLGDEKKLKALADQGYRPLPALSRVATSSEERERD